MNDAGVFMLFDVGENSVSYFFNQKKQTGYRYIIPYQI